MAFGYIELDNSREGTVAVDPTASSRTFHFKLYGLQSDLDADTLATALLPKFYRGLKLQSFDIAPLGNTLWDLDAHYGVGASGGASNYGTVQIDFDVTGEKTKITQSLNSFYYPATRDIADIIDFNGGINVRYSGGVGRPEGIDIEVPALNFVCKRSFAPPDYPITGALVSLLLSRGGVVNSDGVLFSIAGINLLANPGELLFKGASGSQRSGGGQPWEGDLSLRFAFLPNAFNITIAGIPNIDKYGWEYAWVSYEDNDAGAHIVPVARQVNIEQIFPEAPLGILLSVT